MNLPDLLKAFELKHELDAETGGYVVQNRFDVFELVPAEGDLVDLYFSRYRGDSDSGPAYLDDEVLVGRMHLITAVLKVAGNRRQFSK